MTRIQSTHQTAATRYISEMFQGTSFTPEELMVYMHSRLNRLDEAVKQLRDRQSSLNKASEIMSKLLEEVAGFEGTVKPDQIQRLKDAYKAAAENLHAIDPTLAARLQNLGDDFDKHFDRTVRFADGSSFNAKKGVSNDDVCSWHNMAVNDRIAQKKGRSDEQRKAYEAGKNSFNDNDNTGFGDNDDIGRAVDKGFYGPEGNSNRHVVGVEYKEQEVAAQTMSQITEGVKKFQEDIGNTVQANAGDLQACVSQRQLCVQLVQQMMQAQAEQRRKTAEW